MAPTCVLALPEPRCAQQRPAACLARRDRRRVEGTGARVPH
jgi:hypothetical protein